MNTSETSNILYNKNVVPTHLTSATKFVCCKNNMNRDQVIETPK
jgi:hypothetical protein